MAELNQDYIADLRKGIVEAICEVSAARQSGSPPDGAKPLYIGAAEVCQTLTILLAEFLEGNPDLVTPSDVRKMSETIARKLRFGIAEIRDHRAETGGDPLAVMTTRSN